MISITLLPNGNIWALEINGKEKEILELDPWVTVYAHYLRRLGINPLGFTVRLPDGKMYKLEGEGDKFVWRRVVAEVNNG